LVLGDAAATQSAAAASGGAASPASAASLLPQTAQVAGQQGAYAARILCRDYDLTATPPVLPASNPVTAATLWLLLRGLKESPGFEFLNLGLLAYVGGGQALSQIQVGDVPIGSYAGSTSFVLWRSVYLVKQVATRNRVLVTFDWIKSYLFGRDITRL
jgi:NADH dehydrogenase FAD-containing subunit